MIQSRPLNTPTLPALLHFKKAIKEPNLALYALIGHVRIRIGIAAPTPEGVSTGEVKAKVGLQVRAELEHQVHPTHTPA